MSIEAMKHALEALEIAEEGVRKIERFGAKIGLSDADLRMEQDTVFKPVITELIKAIAIAEAQPEQEPVAKGKLKVTLQDTPTEIELAQYKRMFEAACSALGAIGEALGIDEEEGGAEPILAAIEELKAQPKEQEQEPVAFICQGNVYMADDVDKYCTAKHIPLYTKEQL